MKSKPYRHVVKVETGEILIKNARWCNSFFSKLRAFTFRRSLKTGEGLILVDSSDSRVNSGITMFLCFLDLGVIWVNGNGEVVDTTIARPWRLSYFSKVPARYTIEAEPAILSSVQPGDHLEFLEYLPDDKVGGKQSFAKE